jgi:hypothetical protein
MYCTLSGLNKQDIEQVQTLENELDQRLPAFSCHYIRLALLSSKKPKKNDDLEEKLGASLLALHNAE